MWLRGIAVGGHIMGSGGGQRSGFKGLQEPALGFGVANASEVPTHRSEPRAHDSSDSASSSYLCATERRHLWLGPIECSPAARAAALRRCLRRTRELAKTTMDFDLNVEAKSREHLWRGLSKCSPAARASAPRRGAAEARLAWEKITRESSELSSTVATQEARRVWPPPLLH